MTHIPALKNSAKTSPMNPGISFLYILGPARRSTRLLSNQPTNIGNQKLIIGHEAPIRYPIGCNGHQRKLRDMKRLPSIEDAPADILTNVIPDASSPATFRWFTQVQ